MDYLRASIESIYDFVDQIIIVDGRYEDYMPGGPGNSIDETYEYCKNLGKTALISSIAPWKDQMTKRNTYVNMVNPGDYMFIIDGDEIVFGDLSGLKDRLEAISLPSYQVRIWDNTIDGAQSRPRLILKTVGMHYADYHWKLVNGAGVNVLHPLHNNRNTLHDFFMINMGDQRPLIQDARKKYRQERRETVHIKDMIGI